MYKGTHVLLYPHTYLDTDCGIFGSVRFICFVFGYGIIMPSQYRYYEPSKLPLTTSFTHRSMVQDAVLALPFYPTHLTTRSCFIILPHLTTRSCSSPTIIPHPHRHTPHKKVPHGTHLTMSFGINELSFLKMMRPGFSSLLVIFVQQLDEKTMKHIDQGHPKEQA